MNIALIGYGKMGHAIEEIAKDRGHMVVMKISSANKEDLAAINPAIADVAIEFTQPDAAPQNIARCLNAGVPVVCGTTGWNGQVDDINALAIEQGVGLLHASNFSIGVNVFFEVNRLLANLMAGQSGYRATLEETHHLQKLDAPSGTAITLAEQILAVNPSLERWALSTEVSGANVLPINALREDGVPGTHKISWTSAVDTIEIIHTAHSRDGFALGAVMAAEFIIGKAGVFTMRDVLGI